MSQGFKIWRLALIVVGLGGIWVWHALGEDSANNAKATTALQNKDFGTYARTKLGENSSASLVGDTLTITYQKELLTGSWGITEFNYTASQVVPAVFDTTQSGYIDEVTIIERTDFTDIRGNKSVDNVLRVSFSRANASTIHWDNITKDNVPRLADSYWAHPSLSK